MIYNEQTRKGLEKICAFWQGANRYPVLNVIIRPTVRAQVEGKKGKEMFYIRWERGIGWRNASDKNDLYLIEMGKK
jgi:hypothetical protein